MGLRPAGGNDDGGARQHRPKVSPARRLRPISSPTPRVWDTAHPTRSDPILNAGPGPIRRSTGRPLTSQADVRRSRSTGGKKWQNADPSGRITQNVFFGTFNHAIDAKGRTSLPAKFRDALAAAGEPRIVLMAYPHWKSIQALPQSVWTELVKKVMEGSPFDARLQKNVLKFVSSAHEVDLDVHGRVLVPPALRGYAGLAKDVVWAGMGRAIQLWDKPSYEEWMARDIPEGEVVDFFAKV
jgi:MraZ protein